MLNPFEFKRSWKYTVTASGNLEQSQTTEREKYLEQKLLDFEKQLAFFKSCVTLVAVDETENPSTSKGKGRGKKSNQATPQESSSFFDRFRPSFSGPTPNTNDTQSEASTSQQSQGSDPPSYAQAVEATEKTVYIKQVDLLLNGTPLDQIDSRETGTSTSKSNFFLFLL